MIRFVCRWSYLAAAYCTYFSPATKLLQFLINFGRRANEHANIVSTLSVVIKPDDHELWSSCPEFAQNSDALHWQKSQIWCQLRSGSASGLISDGSKNTLSGITQRQWCLHLTALMRSDWQMHQNLACPTKLCTCNWHLFALMFRTCFYPSSFDFCTNVKA